MYLDETILQSNTTTSLVTFIKDLYNSSTISSEEEYLALEQRYNEIIYLHNKAMKKRSRKYRRSDLES